MPSTDGGRTMQTKKVAAALAAVQLYLQQEADEAAAVAASLGFAGGAIGALAAPWVHARRKHLS